MITTQISFILTQPGAQRAEMELVEQGILGDRLHFETLALAFDFIAANKGTCLAIGSDNVIGYFRDEAFLKKYAKNT